ncbi:hypothetical protein QBC36DRAFT_332311 [Triangularia setosa]|uniref:Uncharacterized protein n=1 Tax=Triangularia setosa TaxID=2587417 RepID=A0AAN7A6D9_9PEZI|nr:hypothetical protein QBC36DRAFT_332311 [Podospora setosa]
MAIPRTLPAVLGVISILPTAAILAIHSILARSREDRAPAVRNTAIIAAILEATVLAAITGLTCVHISPWSARWAKFNGLWFGTGLFLCIIAAAVSVANMVCLSKVDEDPESTILGSGATSFLVGSSVVLGLALATQLVFLVFHFVAGRVQGPQIKVSVHNEQNRSRLPPRVKSIAYHETSPSPVSGKTRGSASFEKTPPGSSAGRSTAETISSIRSSLSNVVRPISSKTRLLSQRSRRPASLELPSFHERPRTTEEGFDSWDTSAVDPQNRQTVLESSSPPLGRFLETIPASPTTSRSPSPGTPLDLLEPPSRSRRRSRTLSPAPSRVSLAQRTAFTQHSTQSESHIHPLFRSDSPIPPPPIVTPGTVVVAAPNGGQMLSDRQSIRSIKSLRRMRSGSLPGVPSPLSRQGSCDSFHHKTDGHSPEIREEDEYLTPEGTTPVLESERKMTPPIPDWILSAGSRTSLTTYHSRKIPLPGHSEEASGAPAPNSQ